MTIKKTNPKFIVFLILLVLLVIPPTLAYADDDDDAEDIVENLGWVTRSRPYLYPSITYMGL